MGPMVIALLLAGLLSTDPGARGMLVAAAVQIPFLLWWHWYTGRLRIELSAQGITHRQGGALVLHAPWSIVERIRIDRGHEGIIVQQPMEGRAADRLASIRGLWMYGQPYYDDEQRRLMGERRLIPLDPFGYLLRNGKLLEDLEEFAPAIAASTRASLAEQDRQKHLPRLPASPEQQMRNFWAVLVIFIALAFGLWLAMGPENVTAKVGDWVVTLIHAGLFPMLVVIAIWSSRNAFKAGSKTLGVIFALLAIIQAMWCLYYLGHLMQLSGLGR